ncbi:hypothetical protein AB5J72_41910 [Streptomyces sp. CG1]|uniref:hypothetical protein n=1 Tax=Streptomyces sp. CG1 TaxID=1287523 RepID=UPI0034E19CD3
MGAATAAFLVVAAVVHSRRRARREDGRQPAETVDESGTPPDRSCSGRTHPA